MRAGTMRQRVTLRKPVRTDNGFESAVTYTDVATVWARVDWGSGRRFEEAAQVNAEIQGVITIRYRSDVRPSWQIGYGERNLEILAIVNTQERDFELRLNCREWQD